MSARTVAEARQHVAAAIDAGLGASGWQESTVPWDLFASIEGENLLHKCYAVGAIQSQPQNLDRQRLAEGVYQATTVSVRWSYQLSALDQLTVYDAGLDAELEILQAVMADALKNSFHVKYNSARRVVDEDGYMLGELIFSVHHSLALR